VLALLRRVSDERAKELLQFLAAARRT
jgi:hypothetical protein